jgi:outer membrane protein OmpA-like peptidoglycan-associated protein
MKRIVTSAVVFGALALFTPVASAQQRAEGTTWFQDHVAAPSRALELTVGSGYTQGWGMIRGGSALPDVATPGIGFDLGAGYRINHRWSVGLNGQYNELYSPHQHGVRGMTAGLAATYHFVPETGLDPWLELGTGYRLMWVDNVAPTPNVLSHGFELARARVGIDLRLTPQVAIAPVVGADANVFVWQNAGSTSTISDPRVNSFVYAGLVGRFDIGGDKEPVRTAYLEQPPPPAPETATTVVTSAPVEPAKEPTQPVSPTISVSDEIMRACSLHFSDIGTAPKFAFNKSDLLPADEDILGKIGTCVTTGPLKGRLLVLIGHADPRGTDTYNMALGLRRATGVARFLEQAGIPRDEMQTSSRGERDAIGTDEATWQMDRRVDILLAP